VGALRRFWPQEDAAEPVTPEASAERALLDSERAAAVARLVRTLPPRLRQPLLLLATGDHTYEEMAQILGIPSGTLKGRVAEARRRLIARMTGMGLRDE
jgi:RNA polymerase sigma-70 factor (ECF subfamily)